MSKIQNKLLRIEKKYKIGDRVILVTNEKCTILAVFPDTSSYGICLDDGRLYLCFWSNIKGYANENT